MVVGKFHFNKFLVVDHFFLRDFFYPRRINNVLLSHSIYLTFPRKFRFNLHVNYV